MVRLLMVENFDCFGRTWRSVRMEAHRAIKDGAEGGLVRQTWAIAYAHDDIGF